MKPPSKAPVRQGQGSLGPHAPSVWLPLWFMATGLVALFTAVVCLALRPEILATYHYNQYVIAMTHLVVLGWICSVVMGAMYQLVPVALETRLYSERLARWQFVLHLAGFAGMVWTFWTWNMKQVGHFGTVLAVGVGLFVYNICRTLLRVPRWNVIATAVASALGWLTLVILAGLAVAAGKCSYEPATTSGPAGPVGALIQGLRAAAAFVARFDQVGVMHAHAHLGTVGVFLMLIVGISYKLVPMFALSEVQSPWRAGASIALLNLGLLGSFLAILLRSPLKPVCALVLVAGLVAYGMEMRAILRARKRHNLDWGLKYFLTAIAWLGPLAALGLVLAWPSLPLTSFTGQLENLYGFVALLGVVSFAILGMLYKIIPFLVWYRSYSGRIGLATVPSLADLYSPKLQAAGYWTYLAGLTGTGLALTLGSRLGVRFGATMLVVSLVALFTNVATMLRHLLRPETDMAPGRSFDQTSSSALPREPAAAER